MRLFTLLILFSCSKWILAQDSLFTEDKIQTQSIFIEAIRNKLIDRHDLSIPQFREILKKEPKNHVVWYELGIGLYKTKKYDEALDAAKKAREISQSEKQYLQLLADIYHQKQEYSLEATMYRQLHAYDPGSESIYVHWVEALKADGKWEEAIKTLDLMEQKKGINEISSLQKASIYSFLNKTKEEESELIKLNNTFTDDIKYLHALASFYAKNQKQNKAEDVYKKILALSPGDDKANIALANTFKQNGQDDQYLHSITSLIENPSLSLDVKIVELIPFLNKAINETDKKLLNTLDGLAQKLVGAYPKEVKAHALYADVCYALDQPIKAFEEYKLAIDLGNCPKSVWKNYLELGKDFLDNADYMVIAEKAFDKFPNDALLATIYAQSALWNNQITEAKSILTQAEMMSANNKIVLERIISLHWIIANLENDKDKIENANKQIKDKFLGSSLISLLPIDFYVSATEDYAKVNSLISTLPKDLKNSEQVGIWQAIALVKAKKYSDAKSAFEKIANHNHLSYEYWADTLFMLKENDIATQYWLKASELNPFSNRLKKKLQNKRPE